MSSFKGFAAKGFAAAFLLAFSSAAHAQVNDQSADEIRRALMVWIGEKLQAVSGAPAVELDGQVTVMPDGGLYRVTLPAGRALAFGDGTLHFGEIKIDLTPMENGWYDASWRLPDSYRFEPQNGVDALITIGGQSARGVFAPEFQTMMSFDGELREIEVAAVTEAGDDARLTIDQITTVARSTEVSTGIYDVQSTFRLGQVTFSENGGRNLFELSEIEVSGTGDNIRLAEQVEFQRRASALAMELDGTENIDLNAHIEAFAELIGSMPTLFAGASVEARYGAILVGDNDDQVSVSDGTFSVSMDGLDQDRSQFAIAMSLNGIDTNDPEIARLLPSETRFRLAMIDLPNSELVQLGIGTLRSMVTTDPAVAMLMAGGGLRQALVSAGSTLEIGPIRLASDIASVDLEGVLRPETSSPYGVVAEIDILATGLDALIFEIQQSGGDQDAARFLTLLQTLGTPAPDAGGRSVRTYAFRLDASGALLLNGSDVTPLISGMQ